MSMPERINQPKHSVSRSQNKRITRFTGVAECVGEQLAPRSVRPASKLLRAPVDAVWYETAVFIPKV
jgi:hypothetical protein